MPGYRLNLKVGISSIAVAFILCLAWSVLLEYFLGDTPTSIIISYVGAFVIGFNARTITEKAIGEEMYEEIKDENNKGE